MANSDQYFKASTIAALQAGFFTLAQDGVTYAPNAGLNITPITKATAGLGDGSSYYVNIRTGTIITPPAGVTAVLASEAIPVTGEWE